MRTVKILVAAVLIAFQDMVLACSCLRQSDDEKFKRADAVLLVKVVNTRLVVDIPYEKGLTDREWTPHVDAVDNEIVEAKFRVIETFKAAKAPITVLRALPPGFGNCSVNLTSGAYYLVYLSANDLVGTCSGSTGINVQAEEAVNEILRSLRQLARRYQ